ncbi:hypothetical protein HMPREF1421_00647 [Helicobacter pylori GAM265BSii]|uniref:Uncharacterized protein n=1 Tax=Helicobacter pylori GAM265BSii TaxID=1159049 RepID=M3RCW4_HELPX|nr:hypothetical protein HMPREF1421_00647 [Helicobacter pylori GAM265BSii]
MKNVRLRFGVSFILFGKEKNVKKDSKILDAIMNIIFVIIVVYILFPWLPGLLFYNIWFFSITCYPILNNFYTPLVNLMFISLLCKIKGLCA